MNRERILGRGWNSPWHCVLLRIRQRGVKNGSGVLRPRAYFNALIAAAAFGLFSHFTDTGYHTVDEDPLTGGNGEIVEDDPPEHPTSKLDSAIKVFVIALGCFCYGVYKSDPTKKPEAFQDHDTLN